jgi:hypothetical protein
MAPEGYCYHSIWNVGCWTPVTIEKASVADGGCIDAATHARRVLALFSLVCRVISEFFSVIFLFKVTIRPNCEFGIGPILGT